MDDESINEMSRSFFMNDKKYERRVWWKILFLVIFVVLGFFLIVIGIAVEGLSENTRLIMTHIGVILMGLFISQLYFVSYALPDIVDRTNEIARSLSDPKNALKYLRDKDKVKTAMRLLIHRMFGSTEKNTTEIVECISDFIEKHAERGFFRKNYLDRLTLEEIEGDDFSTFVKENYFIFTHSSEYDVINISGEEKDYRIRCMLENHIYDGIPLDQSIALESLSWEKLKRSDESVIRPADDLIPKLRRRYPEKLTPMVSGQSTVIINIDRDEDTDISKFLDELLSVKISPNEIVRVRIRQQSYMRKQDWLETTMVYFTKGFRVKLIAPDNVHVTFIPFFDAPLETSAPLTKDRRTTHTWGTKGGLLPPNGGGTLYWRTL